MNVNKKVGKYWILISAFIIILVLLFNSIANKLEEKMRIRAENAISIDKLKR